MVKKYGKKYIEECRVEENKQRIKQFKEDDEKIKKRIEALKKFLKKKEKNNG